MPAIKKDFNLLADDIVELSTKNDALKNKIGSYDGKWLEESKIKLLNQIDDEKRANLIMSTMKKHMNKQNKWLISVIINCENQNLTISFLK